MERLTPPLSRYRLWPRRLANQIALVTILLFSLGILFFSVHVARENVEYTASQIQHNGEALAKNISVTGSAYLFSTYYGPLEELLLQAANFPNVVELEVLDTDGMVIREARQLENGRIKIFQDPHQYQVPTRIAQTTIEKNSHNIVIWQPIISGILQGWVRVEMELMALQEKQREIYRNLLSLGGVILIVILAVMLFYMRRPMRDLETLTTFASHLNEKRGDTIDVVKGSEELLKLGTALNRVSAELRQQETDIQTALHALESQKTALDQHSIVSITDVRGNITYANDKFCEASGYSRNELIGQNHRISNSGVHSAEFFKELWRTISQGRVWNGEICNCTKAGNNYWVDTTIVPFLDNNKKPYQYVAIRTDITSLKYLADELIESQSHLKQSQTFANIGNWDWDINTGNIIWSEQVAGMFGLAAGTMEITFEYFLEMVHEKDRQIVKQAIADCLDNNNDYNVEHRVVWPNGDVRWLHEKGNVSRDHNSKPVRMLGVVQDITERKIAEKNIKALEEQMRQSQKMEAIGTMAGGIAHDFNNILTAIIGYAELNLLDMDKDTDAWINQNEILTASSRAKELINQILLFSRKEIADVRVIKPGYVVNEAMRLLRTLLSKTIDLRCENIDMEIVVKISATQFHQAIINLCVNASHAIEEGKKGVVTVALNMEIMESEQLAVGSIIPVGSYAVLRVTDTGCGMREQELAHIFEPFYTTKSVDKGTGMGLAVVYGIVNKAQGAIKVTSTPGKGSCFCLYFPLANTAIEHCDEEI